MAACPAGVRRQGRGQGGAGLAVVAGEAGVGDGTAGHGPILPARPAHGTRWSPVRRPGTMAGWSTTWSSPDGSPGQRTVRSRRRSRGHGRRHPAAWGTTGGRCGTPSQTCPTALRSLPPPYSVDLDEAGPGVCPRAARLGRPSTCAASGRSHRPTRVVIRRALPDRECAVATTARASFPVPRRFPAASWRHRTTGRSRSWSRPSSGRTVVVACEIGSRAVDAGVDATRPGDGTLSLGSERGRRPARDPGRGRARSSSSTAAGSDRSTRRELPPVRSGARRRRRTQEIMRRIGDQGGEWRAYPPGQDGRGSTRD